MHTEQLPVALAQPPNPTVLDALLATVPKPLQGEYISADQVIGVFIAPDDIEIVLDFNPRTFFDPNYIQELADSFLEIGRVISPITVRPKPNCPGKYLLVVGECRYRAARLAKLAAIPCVVIELTDRQALAFAMAENNKRKDTSPAEDAKAARRMLDLADGDYEAARRSLGWTKHRFDSRLLLLHCTSEVLKAVAERRIDVGHAELLSDLDASNQERGLASVLKDNLTVADLQKKIAHFALDLGTAKFALSGCQGCPHNTTLQAELFSQNIGAGRCVKPSCFKTKTREYVEEQRVGLREDVSAVFLDLEKEPTSYHILLKKDVGAAQFDDGCKQCKDFGVLLSTDLGSVGEVTSDVCFNLTCRAQKMAEHKVSLAALTKAANEQTRALTTGDTGSTTASTNASTNSSKGKTAKKKSSASASAPPKKVEELIHATHRRAAEAEVSQNLKMSRVYAIIAMLEQLGEGTYGSHKDDVLEAHGVRMGNNRVERVTLIEKLYALEDAALDQITKRFAGRLASRADNFQSQQKYLKGAQGTLRVLKVDLSKHFVVDKDFLAAHTKQGMGVVLREAGFHTHLNNKRLDQGAFKKLIDGKHEVIVSTAMDSGFDFNGFVPSCLTPPAK